MLDFGSEPPPLGKDDHAVVLKLLSDEDGSADMLIWASVVSPKHALYMLNSAMQCILEKIIEQEQDDE